MKLLEELDTAGYSSLALVLLQNNTAITKRFPWLRFRLAIRSLQFRTAYQFLLVNYDQEDPKGPISPELYQHGRQLIEICLHYAQFQTAYLTSQFTKDYLSMLEIILIIEDKKLLEDLIEKTKDCPDSGISKKVQSIAQEKLQNWKSSPTNLSTIKDWPLEVHSKVHSHTFGRTFGWRTMAQPTVTMYTLSMKLGNKFSGWNLISYLDLERSFIISRIPAELCDIPELLKGSSESDGIQTEEVDKQ